MPRYKLQGRTEFQGLKIAIENKKGSIRRGVDENGEKTEESNQRRARRRKLWTNKYGWRFP